MADKKANTIKGKTSKGFVFEIKKSSLDNMELVDALAELDDGNVLLISKILTMLLGKEQKKALYDSLRTDEGNVPMEDVTQAITEILQINEAIKN